MTLRLVRSKLYNVVHEGSICASSESTYLVVNNVDYIYIYICSIYGHTIFLCHLWPFFICVPFDVIVFNTLRVIRVLCSASSVQLPSGRCCTPGLAGPADVPPADLTHAQLSACIPVRPCLEPRRLSLA